MNGIGLYIHIPFCKDRKCPYCDFYSIPYDDDTADRYTAALLRAFRGQPFGLLPVNTVYFGGGTPSLMDERLIAMLDEIRSAFILDENAEITLEANPGSVRIPLLRRLRESGFNRISFGVQSGINPELVSLGRVHTFKHAEEAVLAAAEAGFGHISADLMLGTPGQTTESLYRSVSLLTELPLDHISAYLLKIEEGTLFQKHNMAASCPDEDSAAGLYLACVEALEAAKFRQYEVSNFAKAGAESKHNLKYWRCEPYLGFGPSAHSYLDGNRFFLPRDLERFLAGEDVFDLFVDDGEGGGFEEYVMLRLRLTEGLNLEECAVRYGKQSVDFLLERAKDLERHGLLNKCGDVISLMPRGFLLLGAVTTRLLLD